MAKHEDERDKLFDEDNCLKDGKTLHVPMMMRDSMTPLDTEYARKKLLVTDGTADPFGLHRPGYRFPVDPLVNDAREEAYRDYQDELTNAWKGDRSKDDGR